jgi:hypothetical protein
MVSRFTRSVPVTVNDVLDGHVALDLQCLDRLYLHGYLAQLQVAQEPQRVLIARQRPTDPSKPPQFSFDKKDRRVTLCYFYLWDASFGPAFIKICTWCPWPVKIWVNGHEWAKQARKAGLAFTELSNGFAACRDPAIGLGGNPGAGEVMPAVWIWFPVSFASSPRRLATSGATELSPSECDGWALGFRLRDQRDPARALPQPGSGPTMRLRCDSDRIGGGGRDA